MSTLSAVKTVKDIYCLSAANCKGSKNCQRYLLSHTKCSKNCQRYLLSQLSAVKTVKDIYCLH